MEDKVMQTFHKSFGQVQSLLDQNRKLIDEINQNQASRIPGRLNRNIRRVVDVYVELSLSFTGSMEAPAEAEAASQGKPGHKRVRA
ncbi:hypothetical protein C4D60_Mb10t22800 [Musa balbisiana]|uniref:Protein EARLY FLOWERING 4 domain-containing protein n=1 Tax=Musa balbisiana TaxID=52838 RepID=A0A4S8IZ73_MUSBA|nr:hypothetical protein C4D60_Mb10t22800 [Musa balbisiana]